MTTILLGIMIEAYVCSTGEKREAVFGRVPAFVMAPRVEYRASSVSLAFNTIWQYRQEPRRQAQKEKPSTTPNRTN
jgi:hypothetical protein